MTPLGRGRLAGRLYLAAPGWSALVGILVVLVTGLLVAAPRVATEAAGVELRHAIADIRGPQRDLVAQSAASFVPGPGPGPTDLSPEAADAYGALDSELRALAEAATPGLRERLGEIDYVARGGVLSAPHPDAPAELPLGNARVAFDPHILDRIEIVDGVVPAPADASDVTVDPVTATRVAAVEIMMSVDTAETLGWEIGQARIAREVNIELRLTGVFEALDPEALVWQHVPSVLGAEEFDDGNTAPRATATVFIAPGTLATVPHIANGARLTVWLPFDATGLTIDQAQTTVAELRRFTTAREQLPSIGGATLRFTSATLTEIERVLARSEATAALLVLVGSGPLGVAGAVLGLAAQGTVAARRPSLALAAARGASPGALRWALALEGALVGVPAAALGLAFAVLLTPGRLDSGAVAVAAAAGLAPAVVFAARGSFPLRRATRADLGAATRGRLRLALDLAVTGLAVLSTVLLVTGGGTTDDGRVDWLAVIAPLLLATCGALLGERLLPAPAGAALARASAGRRLAGFLGLARAVRDPSGSIAGLALVVAVAIAVGSSVLLTTLERGTAAAAAAIVGGDLRVDGPPLTEEQLDELAAIPGIAHLAGVEAIGSVTVSDGPERLQVPAYVVDGAELAGIQAAFPQGLDSGGPPVPFVSSPALGSEIEGVDVTIEGVTGDLLGSAGSAAGIGGDEWLMVDRSASETIGAGVFAPRILLVGLDPEGDVAEVAEALLTALPQSRVTTLDDRIAEQQATPIPGTLRAGFAIAIALAALLAVLAILMSSRLASERRMTLARSLHRLGADRRTIGATFAAESMPALAASLLIGGALGAAIPLLVLASVDLAPVVGGIEPPALAADPLALVLIAVGAFAAAALSILPVLLSSRKESA